MVYGLGFRVWDLWSMDYGLGFGIMVYGLGLWFRV
jgi:hypothetical protein